MTIKGTSSKKVGRTGLTIFTETIRPVALQGEQLAILYCREQNPVYLRGDVASSFNGLLLLHDDCLHA